jgi:calcineurin-like phosphoesterase family protein
MSGKIYVISDLHLSHKNMAIKRNFASVEEHDQCVIDGWNSVVNKGDTVYLLGDVTMEKKAPYPLLKQLKGYINVVLGNHDRRQDVLELLKYVNSVSSCIKKSNCILTHIPIHPSQLERFNKNIHGHLHEEVISDVRYFNVCCEQLDYKPVELNKII